MFPPVGNGGAEQVDSYISFDKKLQIMSQAATETESGTATSDTERSGSSHPTSRKSEYHPRTGSDDGDVSYFDESEKHRSTRSQAAASGSFYSRTGRYPPPAPPRPFGKDDSEQALMKKGQKMNPGGAYDYHIPYDCSDH